MSPEIGEEQFPGLAAVRQRLAKLSIATAASEAGLETERLRAIEEGDAPTVDELERIGDAYGVDADALSDDNLKLGADDGVLVLTRLDEFAEVSEHTRVRMLRAANAARDLITLRRTLGDDVSAVRFSPQTRGAAPYMEGADLAQQLRKRLDLGVAPVSSMRDLLIEQLPWIGLLHARLGSVKAPAGLSFVDARRGPTIVINVEGKNANPLARRFSLAHELCHVLADAQQGMPVASISGFLSETGLAREQRANGFAVRLLCPETVVQRLSQFREEDAARVLIKEYGLPYAAARLYLQNEAGARLPPNPPDVLRAILEPGADVVAAESPRGVADFPLPETPLERRGQLAHAASRAYATGHLARDAFARLLGTTPAAAVESVLGYFEIEAPEVL
jgi:Zn-dependent peptidase ImmA (M78 family)